MAPETAAALIGDALALFNAEPDIEITLEANPSSVEAAAFAGLAAAGVNRVSLGLQSLDDEALHFLGRLHGVEEGLKALDTAQRVFKRVNADFIYARPGQTEDDWRAELTSALALGTDHLSLYQLTIEPGTRFATDVRLGAFTPLDDDPAADLFAMTAAMCWHPPVRRWTTCKSSTACLATGTWPWPPTTGAKAAWAGPWHATRLRACR